jgi:hypothetical protein
MLVYVDESGDPGMKGRIGSSRYFVIILVMFESQGAADDCKERICTLRASLGWDPREEFKLNKCSEAVRRKFFQTVSPADFLYLGVVLNKEMLTGAGVQYKDPFYTYTTKLAFNMAKPYLSNATVVLDECGNKDFRRTMSTYLKAQIQTDGVSPIVKVRMERSHVSDLVQLADMVVGAVGRSYRTDKEDRTVYRKIIAHRKLDVGFWPREMQSRG